MYQHTTRWVLALGLVGCALAKEPLNPKLAKVESIFVEGKNQAAEGARDEIQKGKTCFSLALRADAADAVLEISADANSSMGGDLGNFGGRNWIASATLIKSGDLVWSKSERLMDAPFRSGGKIAGKALVHRLALAADCHGRR